MRSDEEEMKWRENTQLLTKEFSVSIEKMKLTLNTQLSDIETQFNNAILDLGNNVIDLNLETDTLRRICSSLQDTLTILESTIHSQTNKLNEL